MTTATEYERDTATTMPDQRTSVSLLLGTPVVDVRGHVLGRVQELAVLPSEDAFHVHALVLSGPGVTASASGRPVLPVSALRIAGGRLAMREGASVEAAPEEDRYLLLERDLLDQQIIDVHGHKVVRVNDVELLWETSPEGQTELRIQQVEVGVRGAARRLLKGLPVAAVRRISERFAANAIPWEFVDLIDRDPARRVRLKIEQDRLQEMHPSDLADILEELAPAEREALFISLDEEVAAETLEEIEPKMQQSLLAAINSERVADIVEEMDPGAAADLLAEMPEADSDRILEEMEPEERKEVQELLEFRGDSAAGRMTTEYLALREGATVSDAAEALRQFEGDAETITDVYLVTADGHVSGGSADGAAAAWPAGEHARRPAARTPGVLPRQHRWTPRRGAVRQVQPAVHACAEHERAARRRHPCRTGHCAAARKELRLHR